MVAPQSTGLFDQRQLEDQSYLRQRSPCLVPQIGHPEIWRSQTVPQLAPIFLGLILGEIVAAGVWLVLDYFTGHMDSFLTQV